MDKEQIIKALECCGGDIVECQKCAYVKNGYNRCKERASQDALALITSQEQRIKELTEENERLREDNEIKSQKRANIFEIANAFERGRIKGRADTVRKIQERFIAEIEQTPNANEHFIKAWKSKIDQIAKEMLEGK